MVSFIAVLIKIPSTSAHGHEQSLFCTNVLLLLQSKDASHICSAKLNLYNETVALQPTGLKVWWEGIDNDHEVTNKLYIPYIQVGLVCKNHLLAPNEYNNGGACLHHVQCFAA